MSSLQLVLFEFKKYSDLNTFIRRNLEEVRAFIVLLSLVFCKY